MIEELAQLAFMIIFFPFMIIELIVDEIKFRKEYREHLKWEKENMVDFGNGFKINKKYLKELGYRGKRYD